MDQRRHKLRKIAGLKEKTSRLRKLRNSCHYWLGTDTMCFVDKTTERLSLESSYLHTKTLSGLHKQIDGDRQCIVFLLQRLIYANTISFASYRALRAYFWTQVAYVRTKATTVTDLIWQVAHVEGRENFANYLNMDPFICQLLQEGPPPEKVEDIDPAILFIQFCDRKYSLKILRVLLKEFDVSSDIFKETVMSGHMPAVEMFIVEYGFDPSDDECIALQFSIIGGHVDLLEYLLSHDGVDPSIRNNESILNVVKYTHSVRILELVLAHHSVDPSVNNNEPLRMAVEYGEVRNVDVLLAHPLIRTNQSIIKHVLAHAAGFGQVDMVETLLLKVVDRDIHGTLVTAVLGGNTNVVKWLLSQYSSIDGSLALQTAARHGHTECLKMILVNTVVDPSENNNQALQTAARYNHFGIFQVLLAHMKIIPASTANLALQTAVRHGCTEIVSILLMDDGVDAGFNNNQALRTAARYSHVDVIRILLDNWYVDPAANDNEAIQEAVRHGDRESVRLLLADKYVDPGANNNAAILEAVRGGHTDIVKQLLAHTDVDPRVALQAAIYGNNITIVKCLLAHPVIDPTADDNAALQAAVRYGHADLIHLLQDTIRRRNRKFQ